MSIALHRLYPPIYLGNPFDGYHDTARPVPCRVKIEPPGPHERHIAASVCFLLVVTVRYLDNNDDRLALAR